MNIGFIGLGAMGGKMATNLIRKGHSVRVFDVMPAAVERLVSLGGQKAGSAAEAADGAEVVLLSLPNAAIVERTVLGPEGVLDGAKPGLLLIDLSSITPRSIRMIAAQAEKKEVRVIDAPVSGGTAGAEKGTLTIMVGGEPDDFERAKPVLECIGSTIYHVGGVGAGDSVKLVNNLLLGINMAAVGEALALGVKSGIAPDVLYGIISKSSGSSYALTAKYEKFISKGSFAPGFAIDLQYKDLQLAIETAKDQNMPLILGNIAQQLYEIARTQSLGGQDISAIVKLSEKCGNVSVSGVPANERD